MLGILGSGENLCGWLFMMELLPFGVSLHQDMTKLMLYQRQDAAAGTQTAEPLVILTQGRSGTCKNCVTCVSQIGNTKAKPELEKSWKFVTHIIIF